MSFYRSSITKTTGPKPTVPKPQSTSDCRILLERTETQITCVSSELDASNKQIDELTLKIQEMQMQINRIKATNTLLNTQHNQHKINQSYLTKWLDVLSKQDEQHLYFIRCKEYINKYKWVNPDEDEDDGDGKLVLPADIFSYLGITFAPLDSYISDEITKIAHYLKACELIASSDDKNVPANCTYGQMIQLLDPYGFRDLYIIDNTTDCSCGNDNCSDNYKRYGDVLVNLKDIDLDTTEIILYSKRLD
jgi:hypothetical protein